MQRTIGCNTSRHEFLIETYQPRGSIRLPTSSLEGYLIDGDTPFFIKGIRNVAEAQVGISEVAKQTGIAPEVLSEFLFSERSLQLGTLNAILKVFGWKFSIELLTAEEHNRKERAAFVVAQFIAKCAYGIWRLLYSSP